MAPITTYMVQCPTFGDIPPHVFEILKATADSLITTQGQIFCPICRVAIGAAITQANTIVSST